MPGRLSDTVWITPEALWLIVGPAAPGPPALGSLPTVTQPSAPKQTLTPPPAEPSPPFLPTWML